MADLHDIQGILLGGYSDLPEARYVFVTFGEARQARAWVDALAGDVRTAAAGPRSAQPCVQVAFTYSGLQRLQISWQALNGFSREFRQGMAGSERRSRLLGDTGTQAPEHWRWGGPNTAPLDALLMLYAAAPVELEALTDSHMTLAAQHDLGVAHVLDTRALPGNKEHFGFRDGISQPKLRDISASSDPRQLVTQGEFILGYPNERGENTLRPVVDPIEDPTNLLEEVAEDSDLRDLGKHGSYLVFRQLSQDVHGFWSWASTASDGADPVPLAAKMVGRWPGGAPLVTSDADDAARAHDNDFGFHETDRSGLRCPIGSHIRRTNPRDSLPPKPGTDDSLEINRRHRLLRRGRPYGEPLTPDLDPAAMAAADDGADRGLHFLCFNSDISRQFEFVQHTWANNANFAGLQAETDPLIGARPDGADAFTCQAEPVRARFHGLPRFVGVRGGAYLFLPGVRALKYLAQTPRALASQYSAPAAPAIILDQNFWTRAARFTNTALERGITITRRFTRLRSVFDRLLQKPLTALAQWLLLRRRIRHQIDADLAIAEERQIPGEALITQQITQQMTAFLLSRYRNRIAERAGNTKTYGMLQATFEVHELPEELRVGVFKTPRTYDAWVRFGGPGPLATADIRNNGILSIGMKLLGVEGQTLLDDETGTQDFSGISAPTFTTPDVVENLKLQQYVGADIGTGYFLNPFDSHYLDMLMQGLYAKAHGSPFEASYWSCVPYLYGSGRAYKYRFAPRQVARSRVPLPAPDDYLTDAMCRNLQESSAIEFDFRVQFQECPMRMPIEDASIVWTSPETTVATLRIADQLFDTPEREKMARELTINPWHAVAEHRPLGNQNRARRAIYYETARVRQRINEEPHRVPPAGADEG